MKIGVFDSGIGGLSVVKAIEHSFSDHEVIFMNDSRHVPYGTRPPKEILGFVVPIFQKLVDRGCQVIVVACNTVSTTLIKDLRKKFSVPLIAMEPMVKPAADQTRNGVIAVCATPTTLASQRYAWLKQNYAKEVKVVEPDCSDWTSMIENNKVDYRKIAARINKVLSQKADVIVLGCTHYHWIEDEIKQIVDGRAQILQPESSVVKQLKSMLARLP